MHPSRSARRRPDRSEQRQAATDLTTPRPPVPRPRRARRASAGGAEGLHRTSLRIAVSGISSRLFCRAISRSRAPNGSVMNPRGISITITVAPIDWQVSTIFSRFAFVVARLYPLTKSCPPNSMTTACGLALMSDCRQAPKRPGHGPDCVQACQPQPDNCVGIIRTHLIVTDSYPLPSFTAANGGHGCCRGPSMFTV
jgi:hypothetical protein